MGFVRGESRDQALLFPVSLDELVPQDHVCRVIDVNRPGMSGGSGG